jgi:hypothetical protein
VRFGRSIVVFLLCLWQVGASAQDLARARRHYLRAEFEEAVEGFLEILQSPALSEEEAVEAHRYLSALHQMVGDGEAAQRHARAAVALDPTVAAPEGAPEELDVLLDAAREELEGRRARLHIAAEGAITRGERVAIAVRLEPAVDALIATLELRCASGSRVEDARGAPPEVRAEVMMQAESIVCRAQGSTEGGAVLLDTREELTPRAEPAGDVLVAPPVEANNDALWLGLGIGGGVALVAIIVTIAVVASVPQSGNPMLDRPQVEGW